MTTKISSLPTLATVTATTIIPVVDSGATKRVTAAALATYITGTVVSSVTAPGGSSGYVQYNTGSAFGGSSNLYWDASNSRLGIGTVTPAVTLEIDKSSGEALRLAATGANQNIYARFITGSPGAGNVYVGVDSAAGGITGVGNAGYIWNAGNAGVVIGTNNSLKLTVDASGNTGLGVAPSSGTGWASNFELLSTSNIVNQGTDFSVGSNWYYNSGYLRKSAGAVSNMYLKDGTIRFQYAASSTAGSSFTFSEAARIDNSGVLGIGDNAPSSSATRLCISPPYPPSTAGYLPAMKISGGFDNQGTQDNAAVFMQYGGGQVPGGTLLTARTSQHTAFVLNNGGADNNIHGAGGRPNVYVYSGPTFSSYGQPNSAVYANGYQSRMGIYSEMTGMYDGAVLTGLSITLAGSYGGNSTRDVVCSAVKSTTNFGSDKGYGTNYGYWANISGNSTANYAFFASAGDAAKPGGGSWASSSDARVKTVIGDYARGLADVVNLHVVDFQYNGLADTPTDGRTYTGLIAQEAVEVMPEMVHTRNAKLDPEDTSETAVYMVDNSALVYALVNSVKELKSLVDAQAARIAQLEGK